MQLCKPLECNLCDWLSAKRLNVGLYPLPPVALGLSLSIFLFSSLYLLSSYLHLYLRPIFPSCFSFSKAPSWPALTVENRPRFHVMLSLKDTEGNVTSSNRVVVKSLLPSLAFHSSPCCAAASSLRQWDILFFLQRSYEGVNCTNGTLWIILIVPPLLLELNLVNPYSASYSSLFMQFPRGTHIVSSGNQ